MLTKKYKTDKKQLLAESYLNVSNNDDVKCQHKVEIVNLVLGKIIYVNCCIVYYM